MLYSPLYRVTQRKVTAKCRKKVCSETRVVKPEIKQPEDVVSIRSEHLQ